MMRNVFRHGGWYVCGGMVSVCRLLSCWFETLGFYWVKTETGLLTYRVFSAFIAELELGFAVSELKEFKDQTSLFILPKRKWGSEKCSFFLKVKIDTCARS